MLRISLGDIAFLLAADIGVHTEARMLESYPGLRAQVLKSPHHGSRTSSSWAFLEGIRPEVVVISAGLGNAYGVPHRDVLERYAKMGARVLRTDRDGAVEISTDGRSLSVRTAR